MHLKDRILHVLIAFDSFVFVLCTLGKAWPGETISSAAWRMELAGRWQGRVFRPCIDLLFRPLERDPRGHCHGAYDNERAGKRLPPDESATTTTTTTQGDNHNG